MNLLIALINGAFRRSGRLRRCGAREQLHPGGRAAGRVAVGAEPVCRHALAAPRPQAAEPHHPQRGVDRRGGTPVSGGGCALCRHRCGAGGAGRTARQARRRGAHHRHGTCGAHAGLAAAASMAGPIPGYPGRGQQRQPLHRHRRRRAWRPRAGLGSRRHRGAAHRRETPRGGALRRAGTRRTLSASGRAGNCGPERRASR